MFLEILLVACISMVLFSYKWLHRNDDFFKKRGIPYLRPTLFLGNTGKLTLGRCTMFELLQSTYQALPNERFVRLINKRILVQILAD